MKQTYRDYAELDSARHRQVRQLLSQSVRRLSLCITAAVVALVMIAGNQLTAIAKPQLKGSGPSVAYLSFPQFDCNTLSFNGQSGAMNGYAGVRIWANSTGNTPIVDSYVAGYPSYFAPITGGGSNPIGYFSGTVTFPTQPNGTTLIARVYRALQAASGSYDGGAYVDTTAQCTYGISQASGTLYCSHLSIAGRAFPANGYGGIRLWVNSSSGTPLIDSYFSGYPVAYLPIYSGGAFYSQSVSYPLQPLGTTLVVRIYRAPSAALNSWDGQNYVDITQQCYADGTLPTATPHP